MMKSLLPNNRNPKELPFETLASALLNASDTGKWHPMSIVACGNNTTATWHGEDAVVIQFHDTIVALVTSDGVQMFTEGYRTRTTQKRLDWCLLPLGFRLTQVRGTWKVYSIKTGAYRDFFEGMIVRKGDF